MVDIFKDTKEKVVPAWAKFVNAGDSVQGTYVGKIVGQKDGYGWEQIIYQLLQEDGSIVNVGMGLNKKVLNKDMEGVNFGQIIGFRYKGMVTYIDKRTGKEGKVKDFALHQDSKIVNEQWLTENKDNMPKVVQADNGSYGSANEEVDKLAEEMNTTEDVPFSSAGSLTNEDKLTAINKMAMEKLGAENDADIKGKVMESTGIAFIPVNYDKISAALAAL